MAKTIVRVNNLEVREDHSADAQLPYSVYDHDHYTQQTKINYPVLIAKFNSPADAIQWAQSAADESEDEDEDIDDSMDGDHESALTSAGFGTDEDYGCYGDGDY